MIIATTKRHAPKLPRCAAYTALGTRCRKPADRINAAGQSVCCKHKGPQA